MSRVVKMKSRPAVCRIRIGKSICMPWIQGRCEGIHAAPVTGDAIDDVPRGNGVVVPCGINGSIDKDWQVSLVYVEMALQNRVDVIRLEQLRESSRAVGAVVARREPRTMAEGNDPRSFASIHARQIVFQPINLLIRIAS